MGMFDNAKTVETKAPKSKSKAPIVEIAGILDHAVFSALEKSMKTMKETVAVQIKDSMLDHFMVTGMKLGDKPENFKGVEIRGKDWNGVDDAESSCQLRERPDTSPLTPDEIAMLKDHDFPMVENVKTIETFIINPAYVNDEKILKAMEKALAPAMKKGELPSDLFMKQPGVKTTVLGENAIEHLFKNFKNSKVIRNLLDIVAVPSIRPSLKEDDMLKTVQILEKIIAAKPAEETTSKKKAKV
jgi:hypothetical protein